MKQKITDVITIKLWAVNVIIIIIIYIINLAKIFIIFFNLLTHFNLSLEGIEFDIKGSAYLIKFWVPLVLKNGIAN